jgi:hypothetical protein
MYIKIGTATMEPPAPTNPKIDPIAIPQRIAIRISTK